MVLQEIKNKIASIKIERNAIILAHNYQIKEVQAVADYVGDSFELSRIAATVEAEVIVFCGVDFMAESAAILAPNKVVLLPEKVAGCPMADMVTPGGLCKYKAKYPDAAVATYINSSAAVKSESDICVTSANASTVVNSLESERIIFIPDKNLAHFVSRHTDKEIIPWQGYCNTHQRISPEDITSARQANPGSPVIVHPECRPEVAEMADAVIGTSGMIRFVKETKAAGIIVGTEIGMIHRLQTERPDINYYTPTPSLICPNMKYTTLSKVLMALEKMQYQIVVPPQIREKAAKALWRMLAVSAS